MVYADGPGGSGRYWTVTVGVAPRRQAAPTRGFCVETTTIGWRTLQHFTPTPLRWTGDRDRDSRPEFVLWDSFALKWNDPVADFALMAWVYEFDGRSTLAIDWAMSRAVARELVAAYRNPLRDASAGVAAVRAEAARELESFAEDRCAQPMDGAR